MKKYNEAMNKIDYKIVVYCVEEQMLFEVYEMTKQGSKYINEYVRYNFNYVMNPQFAVITIYSEKIESKKYWYDLYIEMNEIIICNETTFKRFKYTLEDIVDRITEAYERGLMRGGRIL